MNYKNVRSGLGECTPTSCPKAGIKIHQSDNDYYQDPFNSKNNINKGSKQNIINKKSELSKPINYYNTTMDTLDLDIDHYSLKDLYNLFNIVDNTLTDSILKNAKQIVLKMHPDKSHLDAKYFLFFSKAYKRLYGIYEFQNKSSNKKIGDEDYYDESNRNILDNLFEKNKDFKDPKNFNKWFNQSFEKHRLENPNENGYGEWLKGDEGIIDINENVTKGNMNEIFEQKKRQIQAVSVYQGVTDVFAPTLGGSLLESDSSFTTDSYTDLRQAYTETLIPITHEDYERMPKFRNVNEYKSHRDKVDVAPLSKEESESLLLQQKNSLEHQSAALAFKYAQEAEKVKQKQNSFWGEMKKLTNF